MILPKTNRNCVFAQPRPVRDDHRVDPSGPGTTRCSHRDVKGRSVIVEPPFRNGEGVSMNDLLQPLALHGSRRSRRELASVKRA